MNTPPQRELYAYWKTVDPQAATAAARHLQDDLRARWPGLRTALFQREDGEAASATLMEVYRHPQGIGDTLQRHIDAAAAAALAAHLAGPRHTEVFIVV